MPTSTGDRFGVLILTHGRPENIHTLNALKRARYSGPWRLVVDDTDATLDRYRELYGEKVVVFSKAEIAKTFDAADLEPDMRTVVYARNASFDIARELGWDYFLQLDDDYTDFSHRFWKDGQFSSKTTRRFDALCDLMLEFLDASGAMTVAFSQGGDYIGGKGGTLAKTEVKRKAMNTFFLRTDSPMRFVGRVNEDVNTYVTLGSRGGLFLTVSGVQMNQVQSQSQPGGMTESYLDAGTYVKSFYTVMMAPSCVRIGLMGNVEMRYHHHVLWNNAVPKILSDRHLKG